MRRAWRNAILAWIVAFSTVFAGNASADVAGGLHDLSIGGDTAFQFDTAQVCVFCHTPHHSNDSQFNNVLLWNRTATHMSGFQLYVGDSMNATVNEPGVVSLMCLSCHDGVTAMNVLLNYPADGLPPGGPLQDVGGLYNQFGDSPLFARLNIGGGTGDGNMGTGGSGGNDLRNDHPIGIDYAESISNGDTELNAFPGAPFVLFSGRIECATCHDVHKTNTSLTRNNFLIMDNSGSAMCLACHNK